MKKYFLAGLVAFVGVAGLQASAQAASRYCLYNPEDPRCYAPPMREDVYDDPSYGDPSYDDSDLPMWNDNFGRHNRRHSFDQRDKETTLTFQFGSSNSCSSIAQSLKRSGFRRVNPIDCAGRDYAFTAFRDGQRLKIGVKSATGRISSIKPF